MRHSITIGSLYDDLSERLAALRKDAPEVRQSRKIVEQALNEDQPYYGINTGFGAMATQRVDSEDLNQLQRNLLLSHAVGVGDWIPYEVASLMLQLKIHALSLGNSGVSMPVFNTLLQWEQAQLIPAMPQKGSVGASGDLAPLAHMSLPLLGFGYMWDGSKPDAAGHSEPEEAQHVLHRHRIEPVALQAKDGLSLINGTQMMSGYGAYVMERLQHIVKMADLIGAMSLEALQGSIKPFDARIQELRPHPGQASVAQNVRELLVQSEILESHRHCGKVQDPYCLRCMPQVHGATRDALTHTTQVIERELNSVTDNPLVFENGDIISGGNFHGQPLALAMDYAAMAMAELASISERRTYLLLEGHDGLPKLLMEKTGINSGFMIPQYTAAALVSENKVLTHPASVDTIPTSMGQEDHVSMGSISALKLYDVLENLEQVLGIELFTAAQALDYRKPLNPGKGVKLAHELVRDHITHAEEDHYFKDDINRAVGFIQTNSLLDHIESELTGLI